MFDLKSGSIEMFSQKITLGMSYDEVKNLLADHIEDDMLDINQSTSGNIYVNRSGMFGLKSVECSAYFKNKVLKNISCIVDSAFSEYIQGISPEKLTRDYYDESLKTLFQDCMTYININCEGIVAEEICPDMIYRYVCDDIKLEVRMNRDYESFTVVMKRHVK